MNKKLKILLVVSLLLNMFLGGVLVGQIPHMKRARPSAKMVQSYMSDHHAERRMLDDERAAALQLLKAPVFDEAAYRAQIQKISRLQGDMYQDFVLNMAQKLRAMPAKERNALIDKMQKQGPMKRGHKHKVELKGRPATRPMDR